MLPSLPVGRITPIIFFVILPAVLIAIGPVFFRISEKGVFALNSTADSISWYAYVIIVLIPGYHAIKRGDLLEKDVKQDIQSGAVVVEFQTVKKIIIIELPIFSTIVALYFISSLIFHIGFFTTPTFHLWAAWAASSPCIICSSVIGNSDFTLRGLVL